MKEAENVSTKARLVARSKDMLWMRDTLINIRDELETDVDRVYFGSTNDADDFRDIVKQLDDWQWSVIMKDAEGEDLLAELKSRNDLIAVRNTQIEELNAELATLRTTLSRQAELLGLAAKALKPFADGLQFYRDDSIDNETFLDWSENIKVGDLRTASSTLDAIRDELKGDANG